MQGSASSWHISERRAARLDHGIAPDMAAIGNCGQVLAGAAILKTELLTDLGGAVQPMEDDVMAIIDCTSVLLRFLPHTTSCQWCGFRFNIPWGV